MKIINGFMKAVFTLAALATIATIYFIGSTSITPKVIFIMSMAFCLIYLFLWREVLFMTVSPLKELRALIMRGVQSITIDYRRIPKCWHIVIEEELQESGYRVSHITGPVRIWES